MSTMITLENTCPFCAQSSWVTVPVEGFIRWQAGAYVQTAFPDLSPDQREILISGAHPDCWDVFMEIGEDD